MDKVSHIFCKNNCSENCICKNCDNRGLCNVLCSTKKFAPYSSRSECYSNRLDLELSYSDWVTKMRGT